MLQHAMFKDAKVELFVKHGSRQWARLGEYPRRPAALHQMTDRSMTGRSPADPPAGAQPDLERRLGTIDAAAVVVSNVIGSGILLMPAIVARLAPDYWALMAAWLVGGLLAFAGAMAYAELATMRPRAGGEYVYLRAAYGPLPAFLTGWTSFVAGFSGAIAAAAVGLAGFLGTVVPALANQTPWLSLPLGVVSLTLSPQNLAAVTIIAIFSAVHAVGLGPGRFVQNTLAAIKVFGLIAFAVAGLTWGHPPPIAPAARSRPGEGVTFSGWLLALVPVMFSYSGWNAAAYVSEEIREPSKRLPRALALGTAIVVAGLPGDERGLSPRAADRDARPASSCASSTPPPIGCSPARPPAPSPLLSILITAGTISAMVFAGPRVYYAMARDGLFVPAAAHVHPRWRTPVVAIAAQGVWSAVLVLSGTFSQLVSYTGFAIVLFAGHRGRRAVRAAVARARRAAPVPGLGLSAGAGAVHAHERGDGRQPDLARARPGRGRARRHRLRRADLLPAPPPFRPRLTGAAVRVAERRRPGAGDCDGPRLWIQCGRRPLWPLSPPPRAVRRLLVERARPRAAGGRRRVDRDPGPLAARQAEAGQATGSSGAGTASDGLAALLGERWDACLLDYHIGDESGFDVLRTALQRNVTTPIIMFTSGAGDGRRPGHGARRRRRLPAQDRAQPERAVAHDPLRHRALAPPERDAVAGPSRPPDRPADPARDGSGARRGAGPQPPLRPPGGARSCSTSITSSRSTTPTATSPATRRCAGRRRDRQPMRPRHRPRRALRRRRAGDSAARDRSRRRLRPGRADPRQGRRDGHRAAAGRVRRHRDDPAHPQRRRRGAARIDRRRTPSEFIARADAALYQAKRNGRNQVVCAD